MKKGSITLLIGLLLIVAALILTGYNLWDNHRAGEKSLNDLNSLLDAIDKAPIPTDGKYSDRYMDLNGNNFGTENMMVFPDYILDPAMEMPVKKISGKKYIGVISIPSIDRELPVLSEWSYPNLKVAPCRYSGSAYLDNMVICAHNYRVHFGPIKNLELGDTVIFTDADGNVFTYRVSEIEILQPTAVEELKTGNWDLSIFTCTLSGRTRITVRCVKV